MSYVTEPDNRVMRKAEKRAVKNQTYSFLFSVAKRRNHFCLNQLNYSYDKVEGELGERGELGEEGGGGGGGGGDISGHHPLMCQFLRLGLETFSSNTPRRLPGGS